MKYRNSKLIIVTMLFIASTVSGAKIKNRFITQSSTDATFLFVESSEFMGRPSQSNFQGKVAFDDSGKGIIIAAKDADQNEGLLRLVSEKVDTDFEVDTYLVDFRLLKSCRMDINFGENSNNLMLKLSPRSLENKKKTKNFKMQVEIENYKKIIPGGSSLNEIKNILEAKCNSRKKSINDLKRNYSLSLQKYGEVKNLLKRITNKIQEKSKDLNSVKVTLDETNTQINDINSLSNAYETEAKNLKSLQKRTNKLKENEKNELDLLKKNIKDSKLNLENKENSKNEKIQEVETSKEEYTKLIEQAKLLEKNAIKIQKSRNSVLSSLSNNSNSKLKLNFDIKSLKTELDNKIAYTNKTSEEIKNSKKLQNENNEQITSLDKELEINSQSLGNKKEEINRIEKEINDLMAKKANIQGEINDLLSDINNKKDERQKLAMENNKIFEEQNSKKEKVTSLNSEIEIATKGFGKLNEDYSKLEAEKKEFEKSLEKIDKENSKLAKEKAKSNNIISLQKEKIDNLNSLIENIGNEKLKYQTKLVQNQEEEKLKSKKINDYEKEIDHYLQELENLKSNIKTSHENKNTFQEILTEISEKLKPVEIQMANIEKEKTQHEKSITQVKRNIKQYREILKTEAPSASIIIDLAEDDAYSGAFNTRDSSRTQKWKKYIEQIIE